MTTMLERAARAAYTAYGFTSPWESDHPFLAAGNDTKELFRSVARAVLMAVRVPSDAMSKAARTTEGWEDMIDAILNEPTR